MSNITLNIVEPGSPTPDPVVPNTGLFTHGIGGPEATIITAVSAVLLLTIVAVVVAMLYKKHKKQGKTTKLVSTVNACAAIAKSKKRVNAGLAAVALLVSAGTFAGLLVNAGKSNTNAAEGEDGLTLDVSSEDLTIEVGDEPVFAVLPVELTVEEATEAGYTLTAYADSTDLVSTTDSSKVIPMVVADEGELVALTDNTYGLVLDEEPTTKDAEVYMPLSTDSDAPTILKATDYVDTEASDTTTIYYGFYIAPDVPYGTYTGSDIYYDVEENYITNLSFDGNGSDGGVDMEGMTIIAGDTITLPVNTFTKEGYSFTGWNTAADGTGKAYADGSEFTASLDKSEDVMLFAQWKQIFYMQEVSEWGSSLETGDEIVATDNRDGKEYYVARLADGNIWMTQNLDLDLNNQTELTPENTNIKAKWKPENSTLTIQGTSVSGWTNSDTKPYSADPGDVYYYTTGDNTDEQAIDKETCERDHEDGSCPHYHAGNYYNWSAAVASNDTSGMITGHENALNSICPAGWRLPTDGDSAGTAASREWNALLYAEGVARSETGDGYTSDGFNKIRIAPLWLARSGGVGNGSLFSTGNIGCYWSSTVAASGGAYQLYFNSDRVVSASSGGRGSGYSVRCIAQ